MPIVDRNLLRLSSFELLERPEVPTAVILDEAVELDDGNPEEFGSQHRDLRSTFSHVNVFGGCCGTDHRHVEKVCRAIAAH